MFPPQLSKPDQGSSWEARLHLGEGREGRGEKGAGEDAKKNYLLPK